MIDQDGDGRVTEGDLKVMLSNLGEWGDVIVSRKTVADRWELCVASSSLNLLSTHSPPLACTVLGHESSSSSSLLSTLPLCCLFRPVLPCESSAPASARAPFPYPPQAKPQPPPCSPGSSQPPPVPAPTRSTSPSSSP